MVDLPDAGGPAVVYLTRDHRACEERALVLRAVGIESEVHFDGGQFALLVAPRDAQRARTELSQYARENPPRRPPPAAPPMARLSNGWSGVTAYAAVLMGFAVLQNQAVGGIDWLAAGRMHAGAVVDGEWWRTLTALTLHLDIAHILGNLMFGAAFGLFAGQLLGQGVAWSTILVAGALGNAINAFVQPEWHRAVGASTAVFAALGLLSAYVWRRRGHVERWAHRWAPLVGGVLLLGWIGTGDERTDIVAHLTGFIAGAGFGFAYGRFEVRWLASRRLQLGLGAAAGLLLALAWWVAIVACDC